VRQGDRRVFTARHEEMDVALQRFPIPFQPDWVVEALGVVPLEESETTLHIDEVDPLRAFLIRNRTSPQGQPIKLVTVVNICHGIILEHRLLNAAGELVARAVLSQHRADPATGAVLPRQVDLDWPQARLGLTLQLGEIELNPAISPDVFGLPQISDSPVFDLGRASGPRQPPLGELEPAAAEDVDVGRAEVDPFR
jgi:hypothetical protein